MSSPQKPPARPQKAPAPAGQPPVRHNPNFGQAPPSTLQQKFVTALAETKSGLIERDEEVELLFAGLVAGENVLLVGPPGVAKSMLARVVGQFLGAAPGDYFEYMLTRFTDPTEIFGEVDLMAWKTTGVKRRNPKGKLPEATVCFLDEVFNANSALLNSLNQAQNERVWDDGTGPAKLPLRFVVGASNLYPDPSTGHENCEAAFDRFLLRKSVATVSSLQGQHRLLWDRKSLGPKLSVTITPAELDQARAEAEALPWSPEARQVMETILHDVQANVTGTIVPRRIGKLIGAAQAAAYCDGAAEVRPQHLGVLAHALWMAPIQAQKVIELVGKLSNPSRQLAEQAVLAAEEAAATLDLSSQQSAMSTGAKAVRDITAIGRKLKEQAEKSTDPKVAEALQRIAAIYRKVHADFNGKISEFGS